MGRPLFGETELVLLLGGYGGVEGAFADLEDVVRGNVEGIGLFELFLHGFILFGLGGVVANGGGALAQGLEGFIRLGGVELRLKGGLLLVFDGLAALVDALLQEGGNDGVEEVVLIEGITVVLGHELDVLGNTLVELDDLGLEGRTIFNRGAGGEAIELLAGLGQDAALLAEDLKVVDELGVGGRTFNQGHKGEGLVIANDALGNTLAEDFGHGVEGEV